VDRQQSEPILEQFEKESGVRVRAVYDTEAAKTTGLVTRLLAESARPRCDVFWNNEPVQTLLLAQRKLLDSYQPAAAADIPSDCKDPAGCWTGIGTRARVIVYNTRYVRPDQLPQSIFDLADPKWRGKVAIANPQFGTTRTHVAALFAVLGPERTQQFLKDLLANQVRIVDGNAMVKNLVARAHPDASPVYLGLTDTDDVRSGQADGEPVDMIYPDQENGSFGTLLFASTVSVIRGAPHPQSARSLADYLVSPRVESQLVAGWAGFLPVRPRPPTGTTEVPRAAPRAMKVSYPALLEQLEPSSQWTREHFHP
jgi:iron(III) transport system substrate-binding protein